MHLRACSRTNQRPQTTNGHSDFSSTVHCIRPLCKSPRRVVLKTNLTIHLHRYPMLCVTRYRESGDPRDKIYGILGIALSQRSMRLFTDIDAYYPTVDYRLSVKVAYLDAAKACMLTQGHGACLGFFYDAAHIRKVGELWSKSKAVVEGEHWPSWVPDWSIRLRCERNANYSYCRSPNTASGTH